MKNQWHPHSTVASICEKDGLYLMVRETVHGKAVYNQPAGHIEDNESIIQACLRETLEETGYHVDVQSVNGIYRYRVNSELTFFRFSIICNVAGKVTEEIDPDIDSVHWMSYQQLLDIKDEMRSPMVIKSIEDYQNGITYPLSLIQNNF